MSACMDRLLLLSTCTKHVYAKPVCRHVLMASAGSSPVIVQLMREGAKHGQKDAQQRFVQKLHSLSTHAGLQAALQVQVQHSLSSWQTSLSKLFLSCPFLTKLDLSKCAVTLSGDDYDKLMSANSTQHFHPCAGAVMRHRPLPVNIELLLPELQTLTSLESISLQLCKVCNSLLFWYLMRHSASGQ